MVPHDFGRAFDLEVSMSQGTLVVTIILRYMTIKLYIKCNNMIIKTNINNCKITVEADYIPGQTGDLETEWIDEDLDIRSIDITATGEQIAEMLHQYAPDLVDLIWAKSIEIITKK